MRLPSKGFPLRSLILLVDRSRWLRFLSLMRDWLGISERWLRPTLSLNKSLQQIYHHQHQTHTISLLWGEPPTKKNHFYLKNPIRIRNYSPVKEVLTDESDKYSFKLKLKFCLLGLCRVKSGFFWRLLWQRNKTTQLNIATKNDGMQLVTKKENNSNNSNQRN